MFYIIIGIVVLILLFVIVGASSSSTDNLAENNQQENYGAGSSSKDYSEMVYVKGGKYKPTFADEEKKVFDLEVGKYPVTQKQYQEIMGNNPSYFKGSRIKNIDGTNRPVEKVSWWMALEFCNKLSQKHNLKPVYDLSKRSEGILMINQLSGDKSYPDVADFADTEGFRLPTEVEWEWFALGGEKGNRNNKYSGSSNINEVAWYYGNSNRETHDVGLKKPNELGLYDCSGNVWEWCYDTSVYIDLKPNPTKKGEVYIYEAFDNTVLSRRLKGGSWNYYEEHCEVSYRGNLGAYRSLSRIGFRLVRTV